MRVSLRPLAVALGLLTFAAGSLHAQSPPSTDLFLVPVIATQPMVKFGNATNITGRVGYDNQPMFAGDSESIFYTSARGLQTDIYQYYLAADTSIQVTNTMESEYSPTLIPEEEALSVIRVEADSTQRLWKFPLDGSEPTVLLPDLKPVGYHAWGNKFTLATFVLGRPPTFQVATTLTNRAFTVADSVGRSFHKIPRQKAFSFVNKATTPWYIDRYDIRSGYSSPMVATLPGAEDHAWYPDHRFIVFMGSGSKLYFWEPTMDDWEEVADFLGDGVTNITRLAVSPDGMKLVMAAVPG